MKKNIIILLLIIISSLIFRFVNINIAKGYWWDETVYLGLAENLYENKEFKIPENFERFRPVFLPSLIFIGFNIYHSEITARIIVLSFSVLSIIATFYLGKVLYNNFVGLIASLFLFSNSLFIFHGQKVFTEPLFLTFFPLAIAFFYLWVDKKKKTFLLAGLFTGLSCLTKHFGYLLFLIFGIYIMYKKKFSLFKNKEFYLFLFVFLIVVSQFFYFSFKNYGNFIGPFLENKENLPPLNEEPLFYFLNFFNIFGLSGIFLIPGFYYALKERKSQDILLLISVLIPIILFNTVYWFHKENRYFIPFFPVFFVLSAMFFNKLKKKILIPAFLAFIIFSGISFFNGYNMIIADSTAGESLKNACLYLRDITSKNEYTISQSYPYVYYIAKRIPIKPPKTIAEFNSIASQYNISYILFYNPEPENPEYLKNTEKVKGFKNQWDVEETVIYKIKKHE